MELNCCADAAALLQVIWPLRHLIRHDFTNKGWHWPPLRNAMFHKIWISQKTLNLTKPWISPKKRWNSQKNLFFSSMLLLLTLSTAALLQSATQSTAHWLSTLPFFYIVVQVIHTNYGWVASGPDWESKHFLLSSSFLFFSDSNSGKCEVQTLQSTSRCISTGLGRWRRSHLGHHFLGG